MAFNENQAQVVPRQNQAAWRRILASIVVTSIVFVAGFLFLASSSDLIADDNWQRGVPACLALFASIAIIWHCLATHALAKDPKTAWQFSSRCVVSSAMLLSTLALPFLLVGVSVDLYAWSTGLQATLFAVCAATACAAPAAACWWWVAGLRSTLPRHRDA